MLKNLILAGLMIGTSQAASAAVITRTYTVTSTFDVGSPVTALTNVYTLTYDPTLSVDDRAITSYSTSSLAPQFAAPIGYSTFANSTLVFGKNPGVNGVTSGTNDFFTVFGMNSLGNITSSGLTVYATSSTNTLFISISQTVGMSSGSAVPEPSTWAMMILGFGIAGGLIRAAKHRSDQRPNAKIEAIKDAELA